MAEAMIAVRAEDSFSGQFAVEIEFEGKTTALGEWLTPSEACHWEKGARAALEAVGVRVRLDYWREPGK